MQSTDPVMMVGNRTTNAEAMVDCRALGYLDDDHVVLDMTYGLGRFWSRWRPCRLVTNDIDPSRDADLRVDWTHPDAVELFGFDGPTDVVFDPPYKLNGTPSGPMDDAYGVATRASRDQRLDVIAAGVTCALTVARRHALVKVQDQVVGGRKVWQTDRVTRLAEDLGARKVDQLLVRSYRPQPAGRRQQHARQDFSTLLIFDASAVT